jgi:hypothetical protein
MGAHGTRLEVWLGCPVHCGCSRGCDVLRWQLLAWPVVARVHMGMHGTVAWSDSRWECRRWWHMVHGWRCGWAALCTAVAPEAVLWYKAERKLTMFIAGCH